MHKLFKLVCLATITLAISAKAQAAEWILASPYPDGSYVTANTKTFADEIRSGTDGAVDIKVHAGASLYKLPQIKRAVRSKQIALGEILLGSMTNDDPMFGLAMMPFLTDDIKDAETLWNSARDATAERLAKDGLTLLYINCWPGQSLFTRVPIENFAGLGGTKFRVQDPNTAELVSQMGATGVRVETADIPQAFLTGIIDGMYTSNVTTANLKGWDYIKYAYDTRAWYPLNAIFVNTEMWDALDADTRDTITKAAQAAEKRSFSMAVEATKKADQQLRDNGVEVVSPPEELMGEFRKIGQNMLQKWTEQTGADGQAVLSAYEQARQ
tara:strand:+ start:39912 stop:40892 length:981 start_codon:yes stop_codon:yes gene_type:complete